MANEELTSKNMFVPSRRDLRKDYSELASIDEFKELTSKEMLFVWSFGKYFDDLKDNPKERMAKSIIVAYGTTMPKGDMEKYFSGNIPEAVRKAIVKMESFELSGRLAAKKMVEKIFDNFGKMVNIEMETYLKDKDGSIDFSKYKQYIDASTTVVEALGSLIKYKEEGFGVSYSLPEFDVKTKSLLANWHAEKSEKK